MELRRKMIYPKIQTLYKRDSETFKVKPDSLRCPEFGLVKRWLITEKIDGRNHRIILHPDGNVEHRRRTDRAQFSKHMIQAYTELVDEDLVRATFDANTPVVIYGELYGPKIQGGGKYRDDIGLSIFDVKVADWWLNWDNIVDIATSLNLGYAPLLVEESGFPTCKDELLDLFTAEGSSLVARNPGVMPEGVVARTDPLLFDRSGNRVMWKLKVKDW